jgi:replicative DNA helicase
MELAKRLPYDQESERIVLGSVLLDHPQSGEIFEMLLVDDFFLKQNQVVFTSLKALFDGGKELSFGLLHDMLVANGELEEAGGLGYITSLGEGLSIRLKLDQYAKRIRHTFVRREFTKRCDLWMDSGDENIAEILDQAREFISELAILAQTQQIGKTFRQASMNLIASMHDEEPTKPMITGIHDVDDWIGGFRAGELCVLTAETGVGKTFAALQIARKSCDSGVHLLFCSGEMYAEHLMGRVLSSKSQIEYRKMRRPKELNEKEKERLMDLAVDQCKFCRVLDGELSLTNIRTTARAMAGEKKLGGMIVDYDELVEVRGKDEWEQGRILVRSLKSIGLELGIPVIIVSQLRKALNPQERANPTLQRLYGSGAKSKHAGTVLYVDRPYVQNLEGDEAKAVVYVLKNRDGKMGHVECTFNLKTLTFEQGYQPKEFDE